MSRCKHPALAPLLARNDTISVSLASLESTVIALKLAGHTSGDAHVRQVLLTVGQYLGLLDGWLDDTFCAGLSRTALSKKRFWMDAGHSLLLQDYFDKVLCVPSAVSDPFLRDVWGCGIITQCLADSSPRAGKDWLLSELYVLETQNLQSFCAVRLGFVSWLCSHFVMNLLQLLSEMNLLLCWVQACGAWCCLRLGSGWEINHCVQSSRGSVMPDDWFQKIGRVLPV